MNQWQVIVGTAEAGNKVTHVLPIDDLREHEETAECWCNPDLNEELMIAVHHSADNREAFEKGERKPS